MNKYPLVSVIIPLFNQKQFVGEAIQSVLNQTCQNIEIIVVNDGSSDNPFPILERYKKNIILINQKNSGLAAARNSGIKRASGEYLQFLDADDFLYKEKIKLQLEFSESQRSKVSYCEIACYENDTHNTHLKYIGEIKDMFSHLYNLWHPYPAPIHALLLKKEIFEKFGLFDEGLKACEDRYLLSILSAAGINFDYFLFIGGFRRLHKNNMNKNKFHIVKNLVKYYKKMNEKLGDLYFIQKFDYTGYQMMCANLTYCFGAHISNGIKINELWKIKKLLNKEEIRFNAKPIPRKIKKVKLEILFFLISFLKRWILPKYFIKNRNG